MALNRNQRRTAKATAGRPGNTKITITYDQLTAARNALVTISKVKGLTAGNKMMIARVRVALRPSFDAIDEVQRDLIEQFIEVGHKRLRNSVLGRIAADTSVEDRKKIEEAAEAIAKPTGVLPPEMEAYQTKFSKHLFEECEVEVPERIPASLVLSSPDVNSDDVYLLDWLLIDDVTETVEPKKATTSKTSTKPVPKVDGEVIA